MKFIFPLKFCGHRRLENGKTIIRFMEISDKVAACMTKSKEWKTWPAKDERFCLLLKNTKPKTFSAYCEFSRRLCRDSEPILNLFQSEKLLAVFLYSKLSELMTSLLERFVRPDVVESNSSPYKLINLGLNKKEICFPLNLSMLVLGQSLY